MAKSALLEYLGSAEAGLAETGARMRTWPPSWSGRRAGRRPADLEEVSRAVRAILDQNASALLGIV